MNLKLYTINNDCNINIRTKLLFDKENVRFKIFFCLQNWRWQYAGRREYFCDTRFLFRQLR